MIRTQIQLDETQARRLRQVSAERGVSMAALIREAVDRLLEDFGRDSDWEAATSLVGKYRGDGGDVARDHDAHLVDAFHQ